MQRRSIILLAISLMILFLLGGAFGPFGSQSSKYTLPAPGHTRPIIVYR